MFLHSNTLISAAFVFYGCISIIQTKPKTVTINLEAKWNSTPIILEASEFIAKENADYFWEYVHALSKKSPEKIYGESDERIYHIIQECAARFLSPLQLNLLKLSISLREYSPTIEMYQQIATVAEPSDGCEAFVDIHGSMSCEPGDIEKLIESAKDGAKSLLYKFDHYYSTTNAEVVIILYGQLGTKSFNDFHKKLAVLADKKEVTYVVRHFVKKISDRRVRLSGFGVELAIKSTEYKAKDDTKVEGDENGKAHDDESGEDEIEGFIFSKLRELHPDKTEDLKAFRYHLLDSATELTPLKVWQLQDLSLQAAQKILGSDPSEALEHLTSISQNFPVQARSLVRINVKTEVKKEIHRNQKYFETYHQLTAGDSALYLNGLPMDMEIYDIFMLLDTMRSEAKVMEGFYNFGFKGKDMKKLLMLDLSGEGSDTYALDIRHSAVQYINDLEKDRKYKNWPNSVQELLKPSFPGMLRHIAKNFFHLVFIIDPTDMESRELIKMSEAFYVHNAPFRIAMVFAVNSDPSVNGYTDGGVALSRAYNYIYQEEKPTKALSFVTDMYEVIRSSEIDPKIVISEFMKKYKDADKEMVFGDDKEYDTMRKAAADFIHKCGLREFPQVLINGVPLNRKYLSSSSFEEGVVSEILEGTTNMQNDVYQGHVTDGMNILDYLMEKENVMPRLNSRVLSSPSLNLDLTEKIDGNIYKEPETFSQMNAREMTGILEQNMKYLTRKEEEYLRPVTMWVVCDIDTPQGRELFYSAIKHMKSSYELRLGVIFNPLTDTHEISKAVYVALNTLPGNIAKSFVTKLVKEENVEDLKSGAKTLEDLEVHGMDMQGYLNALKKEGDGYLKVHRSFVEKVLNIDKGGRAVITNGRVIGPFEDNEDFLQDDYELQEKFIFHSSAKKIKSELKSLGIQGESGSNLVMKVSSLLSSRISTTDSRKEVHYSADQHSVIKIPADNNAPSYYIEAVVDPVSREAQKLGPILMVLREIANVDIRIYMNSKDKLSEMPLTSFYRFVLEPEIQFKSDGSSTVGPNARFSELPQKSLLTLNMHPPESWLVESVNSPYDLDNILLEEVESGVDADFELEYLLLEGHCHDANSGQPPRGLQFTLGANKTTPVKDTIVMANLGYFQLKANPGAWYLQLREGRSDDIYKIDSHDYTDSPKNSDDVIVVMSSFKSKIIRVKVVKKPGKERVDLLKDDDEKGLWDSISRYLSILAVPFIGKASSFTGSGDSDDKDKTLNIFSVASGHLYERFLRIMMLSVLKQTKSKVKFWFLKNYLSPTFKNFIPYYSKEYAFEYELVQYKWPRWLNQQKEKQRIIWGYKILFLDVLFPLDVKKFIFVDADQIVRTDLQELHDIDLGGAPYGYTPFCDSRKEMDGFRFWRSGYWASHLAGRKYHISALYVVDLKKFRRIAAGDRLRGQYQGLSHDPNSLANLDQDLPNNMIHQVNIKSLPQEWLYCETWCSESEKAKAKTIDLCNNPLTKEPKLKAAMRIVPEWKDYDYEIKVLWDKIYGTRTTQQIEYEITEDKIKEINKKFQHHDEL